MQAVKTHCIPCLAIFLMSTEREKGLVLIKAIQFLSLMECLGYHIKELFIQFKVMLIFPASSYKIYNFSSHV